MFYIEINIAKLGGRSSDLGNHLLKWGLLLILGTH
jgi:hypothetical protein